MATQSSVYSISMPMATISTTTTNATGPIWQTYNGYNAMELDKAIIEKFEFKKKRGLDAAIENAVNELRGL